MPILSYQHYARHKAGIASQLTKLCKFCDMKIFKDQMKIHSSVHQDQYFRLVLDKNDDHNDKSLLLSFYCRCLLGSCAKSPTSFAFMYNNVLLNHQGNPQSCPGLFKS